MSTTITPNMNLIVPTVGNEPGPDYGTDINSSLGIIDQHTHAAGSGVQITPAGININSALPFGGNFATGIAGLTLTAQSGTPAINTIYESGVDLYFVDGNGNNVRMTQSGAVAGTPGSISNLVAPASASYVAVSSTFVWQSGANIAANMDAGSLLLRNLSPNSTFAVTIDPPAALSSNYSITLPTLPAATSIMTMSAAGVVSTTAINQLVPPGVIIPYGGTSAPSGYLICDGAAVSRSTYAALFAAIGTAYGYGDNSTTFNVPDTRGFFLRGVDNGAGRDPDASSRTQSATGGNTGDNPGSFQSEATARNGLALSDPGHSHTITRSIDVNTGANGVNSGAANFSGTVTTAAVSTGVTLGPGDAETRPFNLYVNYIIKT